MTVNGKQKQLEILIEKTLAPTPFEVVLVEFQKAGRDWVLRIFIDHPEGITIEHCQSVTHMITDMLAEHDPVKQDYHIEVSSPGVDRPLTKLKDYRRFLNERIFVKTHRPVDGLKQFTGELLSSSEISIEVCHEGDGKAYSIPLKEIAKATLKPILKFT